MPLDVASDRRKLDSDEIQRCFNALRGTKDVVVDVETSGLDKHRCFVVGYVFTVGPRPDDTWYLPVRHADGGNIPGCRLPKSVHDFTLGKDDHPIEADIRGIFRDPNKHWVGHNIKYDMHLLSRHGIVIEGTVEDTRVNAALIDELQGSFDLDTCAARMKIEGKKLDIYPYISRYMLERHGKKVPEDRKAMEYFWITPGDGPAGDYAHQDGVSTYQLWQRQLEEISKQELGVVHGVEKRVTKSLFRMERRGVAVDEYRLRKVEQKIEGLLEDARKKLPKDFNVRSSPQIKALMEKNGQTDWPLTAPSVRFPNGQPSFTEKFLVTNEIGRAILRVRKYENLNNTFVEGSVKSNLFNGRVHCDFNQVKTDEYGTVSGRLSSSGPNMQQIPKRDKEISPLLRQIYRPMSPFRWWSADYSQQEYRVFAHFAKSRFVLKAYTENPKTDYHQLVADMLGVERDPAAKRINLGVIYGMGVQKLADSLGCDLATAQGYMNRMRAAMPEAKKFNQDAQIVAERRGYVKTKLGRRRRFPGGQFSSKAGNAVIQGTSADMTKLKMAEIDEFLIANNAQSGMILQIHDSLEFEFLEEERHLMDEAMRIMCSFGPSDVFQLDVPIVNDVAVGDSWGHATFSKYTDWV